MRDLIDHRRHHTLEAIVAKAKRSAGILMYRRSGPELEVLLVHPGGPFWKNRDDGAWSIPKGLYEGDKEPPAAARREFAAPARAPGRITGRGHRRPRLYRARIVTWSSLGFKYPGGLGAEPLCWRDRDGG